MGHKRNNLVKLLQISTIGFGEEDFLRISSCLCSAKSPPPLGGHVFRQIKISQTIFEKGDPRNIHVKLFQNWTKGFRKEDFLIISSCPYSAKGLPPTPPPPPGNHVFQRIKISQTILKRVTQGTIFSNYFNIGQEKI